MLVLFLVLIIAPLVARTIKGLNLPEVPMQLLQPLDANNNDTVASYTGSHLPLGFKAWKPSPPS